MLPVVGITGGNGFLGKALVEHLLSSNYHVVVIVRNAESIKQHYWFSDVQVIETEIFECEIDLVKENVEVLIHLAWGELDNYSSPKHFFYAEQSEKFLNYQIKKGLKHIVVSGTCQEYGMRYGPIPATSSTNPTTKYAQAKDQLHKKLFSSLAHYEATLSWARIFYTYGNGQSEKSILAQLDKAILNGDEWFDMSMGEQLRDYSPVEDVAAKLAELVKKNYTGTYNIGSGRPISIRRLVDEYVASKNAKIKFRYGVYPYPNYEPLAFWAE